MTKSTSLPERAWLEVDLRALVANARTVQQAAQGARLLPMVKADSYGTGVAHVVHALEGAIDPWGYGVATLPEARELRELGVTRPVIVFTPALAEQVDDYRSLDARAVLDDLTLVPQWPAPFHLEIDTGMGRAGVRWDDAGLGRAESAFLEGVFTHFHSADEVPETAPAQLGRFDAAVARLRNRPRFVHAANSAGTWVAGRSFDIVRPGVFLYGARVGPGVPHPRPVVSWRARIVSVRTIPAGETVSYGAEWTAGRESRIATVAAGFADGVPRSLLGRGSVLVNGRRCPIAGRVTMDMLMLDVTDAGPVQRGDVATLIGTDRGSEIRLDEFAAMALTSTYEILVRVGPRVQRVHEGV